MVELEAINKFMSFTYNYSQSELEEMFQSTHCAEHLKTKFKALSINTNGTEALLNLYRLLDERNKQAVVNYIINK